MTTEMRSISDWSVFDVVADAMVIVGAQDGIIAYANPKVFDLLAWPMEDLVGRPVEVLVPPALKSKHEAYRSKFAEAPKAREMGLGLRLSVVRRDGMEIPVTISLSPIERDGALYVIASIRDVTMWRRETEPPNQKPMILLLTAVLIVLLINTAMVAKGLQAVLR